MSIKEVFVQKATSARFIVVILLTATACVMAYNGRFPVEAFSGLVTLAVRDYFDRKDRSPDTKNQ